MKKQRALFLFLGISLSFGCVLPRKPSSVAAPIPRFDAVVEKLNRIQSDAPSLNSSNCLSFLYETNQFFQNWQPDRLDQDQFKNSGASLLKSFFQARISLHRQMENWPNTCLLEVRSVFVQMRLAEDLVGLVTYGDKQITAESINFENQAVPLLEASKYRPFHSTEINFQFKPGDIMITKGVSAISSTISSVSVKPSLFSHIVFVYKDPASEKWGTIESYIGKGVDFYPMDKALLNENARILVLRPKNQALAKSAHDYMFHRVSESLQAKKRIPYDYQQDFTNSRHLSCEEIAYDAFKTASSGNFIIPWIESAIDVKDRKFVESAGLRNGNIMLPGDMETDPRFDIVLDWTDYRLMRDNWRKDAVTEEMVRWINDESYIFRNTLNASLGKLLWKAREIKYLWPLASKISGIPRDFEVEVPADGIALIANLRAFATPVVKLIQIEDEKFFKTHQRWMSRQELRMAINKIRVEDLDVFRSEQPSAFHHFFRAKGF